jgi:hypothetical protein
MKRLEKQPVAAVGMRKRVLLKLGWLLAAFGPKE